MGVSVKGAYAQYAATCLLLAGIMGGLIISGKRVAHAIDDRMTALWRRAVTPTLRALNIARSSASNRRDLILMGLRSGWRHYMCPALPVLAIAYLGITVGNRLVFTAVDQAGLFCEPTKNLESIPDAGALVSFETSNICFATGYKVARLEGYYVWTNPDPAALARQYKDYATSKDTCKVTAATAPSIVANGGVETNARGYSTFYHQGDGTQLSWTRLLFTSSYCHFGATISTLGSSQSRATGCSAAKWTSWSLTPAGV